MPASAGSRGFCELKHHASAGSGGSAAGAGLAAPAVVAPAGFEPAISALRGLRPRPLDDGAALLVGGVGFEPTTSCV